MKELREILIGMLEELLSSISLGEHEEKVRELWWDTLNINTKESGGKVYAYLRGVKGKTTKNLKPLKEEEREKALNLVNVYRAIKHADHLNFYLRHLSIGVLFADH